MRYSIRKVSAGTTTAVDGDVWEVLKTPSSVDPYLIATFNHPSLARWCLSSMRGSIEVQRWGGEVEDPPPLPTEPKVALASDTPDELVW